MNTLPFKWRKSVRNLFQYQAKPASEKNCGHICDSLTMLLWLPYLICSIWCVEYVQLGVTFQFTVPLSFSGLLSHPSMVQFFPPFEFVNPTATSVANLLPDSSTTVDDSVPMKGISIGARCPKKDWIKLVNHTCTPCMFLHGDKQGLMMLLPTRPSRFTGVMI